MREALRFIRGELRRLWDQWATPALSTCCAEPLVDFHNTGVVTCEKCGKAFDHKGALGFDPALKL